MYLTHILDHIGDTVTLNIPYPFWWMSGPILPNLPPLDMVGLIAIIILNEPLHWTSWDTPYWGDLWETSSLWLPFPAKILVEGQYPPHKYRSHSNTWHLYYPTLYSPTLPSYMYLATLTLPVYMYMYSAHLHVFVHVYTCIHIQCTCTRVPCLFS